MLMNIPEDVAQRLNQLAQQENSSVGDLLKYLLDQYTEAPSSGSLADMAQNAQSAKLSSLQQVHTAEQSREILNSEYGEYLKNRIDKGQDGDSN